MSFTVKRNIAKGDWCPWELWHDDKLIDAFVSEKTAMDRKKLYDEIEKLKCRKG